MSIKRPFGEAARLQARNNILEATLTKVWAWSNDNLRDVDELQFILRAADEGVKVTAALDRLEIGGVK